MLRLRIVLCMVCLCLFTSLAQADVVTDWNNLTLSIIKAYNLSPPVASRTLAMVHAAIYDSVDSIYRDYRTYLMRASYSGPISPDCAAATAAYRVLVNLFPSDRDAIQQLLFNWLATEPNYSAKMKGFNLGAYIGNTIVSWRMNDGWNKTVKYTPGTRPGDWVPTPPGYSAAVLPNWGKVKPFGLKSPSQMRPPHYPLLTSVEYAEGINEVQKLGAIISSDRTDDQTEIAHFWSDGSGTYTPPGHWNVIAQIIAEQTGNTMYENARLFALLNIALADAAIAAWDCKYYYSLWRPITAIREADLDGNPLTIPDPTWTPLLITPAFPEYVSGHSTFSGAASRILALFFGTDDFYFTVPSYSPLAGPRSFNSFSDAAEEAGRSRIYGGVHYEFSNQEGLTCGYKVGNYIYTHFMQPI